MEILGNFEITSREKRQPESEVHRTPISPAIHFPHLPASRPTHFWQPPSIGGANKEAERGIADMTIQEQWHRMKGNKESLRFFYTVQHYLMSRPGGVCR